MATAGKKTNTLSKTAASTEAKKPATKKAAAGVGATAKTSTVTAAKKVAAKPAAPKPAAKKSGKPEALAGEAKPVKKTAAKTAAANNIVVSVSPEHRYHMIATAAYFLAERRGFAGGYEMHDWISAEAEVDAKLKQS